MDKITIKYSVAKKIYPRLDNVIEEAMKEMRYVRYGSGYNFRSKERDLAFERKTRCKAGWKIIFLLARFPAC